jgi:glycosyltransferase involved in cell wall biosynthesis
MKISFVVASLWLSGGERILVEYANRLSERGHQVTIVVPAGTVDPEMAARVNPGVTLIQTKLAGSRKMSLAAKIALTFELAISIPRSDIILTTYTPVTPAGWMASRLMRRGDLVWLYLDFVEAFEGKPFYLSIAKIASRHHDAILTISQYLKDELISWGADCPISVVGLALSESGFYHPSSVPLPASEKSLKSILYLGDTRPRKGLNDFLAACKIVFQQIPEIELWICLKDAPSVLTDLPHRFFQRPTHEELAQLYATCSLFVSSSWREGFSLPPLEAMACGAPVVMTDSGGNREFARSGENCLLVSPRRPELLAEAINEVLENPALSIKMRQEGPRTAAFFNWDVVMNRFEQALVSFKKK